MERSLLARIKDDESEGLFQVIVYPSPTGKFVMEEPCGVFACSHESICSVASCLSKRQQDRLYLNLTKLFGLIDSSIDHLKLSPSIYKSNLSEGEMLETIIPEGEDDEDVFYIWQDD